MDFVDEFMSQTSGIRSPEPFRLWTAITILASVLERRVWTHTDRGHLHPNLYTILAGAPAAGKGLCVTTARSLLAGVSGLHLGPDNPTKAAFLDCLEAAVRLSVGTTTVFSAMAVVCREFGVLLPKHDTAFIEDLTDIYDNPPLYTAPRRVSKSVSINKPTVNILAAVTPDFIGDLIPETAWGQGFTSRLLFIYGTRVPMNGRDAFAKREDINASRLVACLKTIFEDLEGEFNWDEDARSEFNTWVNAGMDPIPNYGRLVHYIGRRDVHLLKLSMISAVSANQRLCVKRSDYERAKRWLLDAEARMPDVFRAMSQKSDAQLIKDLHFHVYSLWARVALEKRKPVPIGEMWKFLEEKAPTERVPRIIEAAIRSGWFVRGTYPDEYIPKVLE